MKESVEVLMKKLDDLKCEPIASDRTINLRQEKLNIIRGCVALLNSLESFANDILQGQKLFDNSLENLKILLLPDDEILAQLNESFYDIKTTENGQKLSSLLRTVEDLRKRRKCLFDQLKGDLLKDDIVHALFMALDEDYQEMFDRELKKHDKAIAMLEQTFGSQKNLIVALSAANAALAKEKSVYDRGVKKKCALHNSIIAAHDVFLVVEKKVNEGRSILNKHKRDADALEQRFVTLRAVVDSLHRLEENNLNITALPSSTAYDAQVSTGSDTIYSSSIPAANFSFPYQNFGPPSHQYSVGTANSNLQCLPIPPRPSDMQCVGQPMDNSMTYQYGAYYLPQVHIQRPCYAPSLSSSGVPLMNTPYFTNFPQALPFQESTIGNNSPIVAILNENEPTINEELPPPILPTPSRKVEQSKKPLEVTPKPVIEEEPRSFDKPTGSGEKLVSTVTDPSVLLSRRQAGPDANSIERIDSAVMERIEIEAARFKKLTESLDRRSLNGATLMELHWKEASDHCDAEHRKHTISIAKCYPFKNRTPDLLPYDSCRVRLQTAKDDYINASYVEKLSDVGPRFIITQAPTVHSIEDFWLMIFEQNVELICSIITDSEVKEKRIWPDDKQPLETTLMFITVVSQKVHSCCTERVVRIFNKKLSQVRCLVHLQYGYWMHSSTLSSLSTFVNYLLEARRHYLFQWVLSRPVCVQSLYGSQRSAVFCLCFSVIMETLHCGVVPQIDCIPEKLNACRKRCLSRMDDLHLCYNIISTFFDILLNGKKLDTPQQEHPVEPDVVDPISDALRPLMTNNIVEKKSTTEKAAARSLPVKEARLQTTPTSTAKLKLLELMDPDKFTLDTPSNSKRKLTKQDFIAVKPQRLS